MGPGRLGRWTSACTAASAVALGMLLILMTGVLSPLEQRLSDAWFSMAKVAPSGRTILVTIDQAATRRGTGVRLPRADLAKLLLQLEAAGASRILIELGL